MDKHIEELYEKAIRFDESEWTGDENYRLRERITFLMEDIAELRYGEEGRKFMEEFLLAIYDVCHYEFLHYFEQGYLMGKAEQEGKEAASK